MKQIEVFNFIKGYKETHNGNSPSFDEIMEGCNISSKSTVTFYLDKLEEQGYIKRDKAQSRSITISD